MSPMPVPVMVPPWPLLAGPPLIPWPAEHPCGRRASRGPARVQPGRFGWPGQPEWRRRRECLRGRRPPRRGIGHVVTAWRGAPGAIAGRPRGPDRRGSRRRRCEYRGARDLGCSGCTWRNGPVTAQHDRERDRRGDEDQHRCGHGGARAEAHLLQTGVQPGPEPARRAGPLAHDTARYRDVRGISGTLKNGSDGSSLRLAGLLAQRPRHLLPNGPGWAPAPSCRRPSRR
jgi:hypothetical protein